MLPDAWSLIDTGLIFSHVGSWIFPSITGGLSTFFAMILCTAKAILGMLMMSSKKTSNIVLNELFIVLTAEYTLNRHPIAI